MSHSFRSCPAFIVAVVVPLLPCLARAAEESGAAASAEVPLSQVVADVLTNHPEIRFYESEIDAARAGRRVAGAPADPELSIQGGRKRVHDPAGTLAGEGTAWAVSISRTFEWPGRLALRKSIANRHIELAELGLARFKSAVAARTRVLACALHAATEKAEAAREVADRYRSLREVFLARDPAGITPLLETRVIEAQELALERRATEAEIGLRTARAELNLMRGAPLDAPLRVSRAELGFPPTVDEKALVAAAHEGNFTFRQRRLELEQQVGEVHLARHERRPSVTVSPFFARESAAERETTVGLGITVPLPAASRTRGGIELAEARKRQAEAALHLAQRELEREVLAAAHAYRVKVAEVRSWTPDAARKFRDAAALADRHYRLGAVPIGTYVELQNAYLDAVEALLDTEREALEAGLRLEELTGRPLQPAEAKP